MFPLLQRGKEIFLTIFVLWVWKWSCSCFLSVSVQSYAGMQNASSWRSWLQCQSILVFFQLSMIYFSRCIPCCVQSQLTMSKGVLWLMSSTRWQMKFLVRDIIFISYWRGYWISSWTRILFNFTPIIISNNSVCSLSVIHVTIEFFQFPNTLFTP